MTAPERWLPVPDWEGAYEVSDQGRVRSLDRMVRIHHDGQRLCRGKMLKPSPASKYGHLKVAFTDGVGVYRNFQVHQLVMRAFVGPCPEGMEVRHLDSMPWNNVLTNLTYGTRAENTRDSVENGSHRNTRKTNCPTCELPYDEENTYWYKDARQCRNCRARRSREQVHVPSADLPPDELERRRAGSRERMRRYNERKRQTRCSEDSGGKSSSDQTA